VAADVYALAVQQISPLPKSKVQRQRKRKTEGAAVVTSSPYKQQLLDKEKKKQQKTSRGVTKCSPKKCEKKRHVVLINRSHLSIQLSQGQENQKSTKNRTMDPILKKKLSMNV